MNENELIRQLTKMQDSLDNAHQWIAWLKNELDRVQKNALVELGMKLSEANGRITELERQNATLQKRIASLAPAKSTAAPTYTAPQTKTPERASSSRQKTRYSTQPACAPRQKLSKPETSTPPRPRAAAHVSLTGIQEQTAGRAMQSYNQLARLSGFDAREQREAFLKDYDVTPISCTNDNERMSAPDTPPIFRTAPSALKAHAWAVPLGGSLYAVLPRSNITYDSTLHTADALSEAFDSNYDAGAYNTIELQSPALFQNIGNTWTIAEKGRLRLL